MKPAFDIQRLMSLIVFLRMAMEQKRIEDRMRPVVQNIIREAVIERMKSIIREAANLDARASKSRSTDAHKQETNGLSNMTSSFGNSPSEKCVYGCHQSFPHLNWNVSNTHARVSKSLPVKTKRHAVLHGEAPIKSIIIVEVDLIKWPPHKLKDPIRIERARREEIIKADVPYNYEMIGWPDQRTEKIYSKDYGLYEVVIEKLISEWTWGPPELKKPLAERPINLVILPPIKMGTCH